MNRNEQRDAARHGHGEAQILAFRPRVRAPSQPLIALTEFGSGWYHDAAIKEAEIGNGRLQSVGPRP